MATLNNVRHDQPGYLNIIKRNNYKASVTIIRHERPATLRTNHKATKHGNSLNISIREPCHRFALTWCHLRGPSVHEMLRQSFDGDGGAATVGDGLLVDWTRSCWRLIESNSATVHYVNHCTVLPKSTCIVCSNSVQQALRLEKRTGRGGGGNLTRGKRMRGEGWEIRN